MSYDTWKATEPEPYFEPRSFDEEGDTEDIRQQSMTWEQYTLDLLRADFLKGYLMLREASLMDPNGRSLIIVQQSIKAGPGFSTVFLDDEKIATFKTFRGCPVRAE